MTSNKTGSVLINILSYHSLFYFLSNLLRKEQEEPPGELFLGGDHSW